MKNAKIYVYDEAGQLSAVDRISRILLAKAIVTVPVFFAVTGAMGVADGLVMLPLMALYPLLTAMVGWDPLYAWADQVKQRRALSVETRAHVPVRANLPLPILARNGSQFGRG